MSRTLGSSFLLILLLGETACYRWLPEPLTPAATFANYSSQLVRFTLVDRRQVVLFDPVIVRDTIWALRPNTNAEVSVPLSRVTAVERRHLDARATALTIVAVAPVVLVAVGIAVYFASGGW